MYHRNGGPTETEDFVHLRVTRRLQNPSDIIAAESIKKDPILQDLLVLRMPKHTNYKLSQARAKGWYFSALKISLRVMMAGSAQLRKTILSNASNSLDGFDLGNQRFD